MNDTEVLEWIADHLTHIRIGFGDVYIEWIDDNGFTQYQTYRTVINEPDAEILRHIVTAIASHETIDQTRIRTGECVG
jgi:hypothetical protein